MECREIKEYMPAVILGEVQAGEWLDAFYRHLETCAECQAEYNEMSKTVSLLQEGVEKEEGLTLDAEHRVFSESAETKRERKVIPMLWRKHGRWIAAAAAIVIIAGVAGSLFLFRSTDERIAFQSKKDIEKPMPRNEMDQKKAAEGEKGGDASYDSARPDETTAKVEKAGKRRASSGSEKETGGLADSEEGEVALDELQLSADSKGGSRNERKGASDAETFFRAEKQKKAEKQEKEKVSVIDKDRHQAESSTEEKQRSPVVMKKAVPRRTASKEDEKEERSEAERVQTSPKKKMAEPGRADQKKETAASGDSKVARTDKKMALRDSASADKPEDARNIHVLHAKTLPSQLELLEKYVALRNDSLRKRITPFGLVNSFDYGYAPGKGRISIHTEAGPSPFSENEVLIKIGIVDNNLYKKPSADKSVFEKANQNDMAIGRVVFESATVAGDAWGNQESRKYSPEASSSGAAGSEQGLPGALTYLYELEIAEVLHKKETEDTLQLGKVVLGKGITGKETVTYPLSFRKSALIGDPPVKENPGLYLAACAKTFAQIIKKPPGKPRSDALDLVQRILTVVGANVPQNQEAKRLLQTVAEYAQTPTDVDGKE